MGQKATAAEKKARRNSDQRSSETDTVRLIPDHVAQIAERVADGHLASKSITSEFQVDDENLSPFLEHVNRGDDERSLEVLCQLLRFNPMILQHPVVWATVQGLYQNPLLWFHSGPAAEKWIAELAKAFAQGLTHGWNVEVTKPALRPRGHPPVLFPHLYERDGWMPTAASYEDHQDLFELLELYEDLHERLRQCDNWKALSAQFRTHPQDVVEERAVDTQGVFEQFKRDRRWSGRPLSEADYRRIVRDSFLEIVKNHSPRHALTCELLATLHYNRPPDLSITANLIDSSVVTAKRLFRKGLQPSPHRLKPIS